MLLWGRLQIQHLWHLLLLIYYFYAENPFEDVHILPFSLRWIYSSPVWMRKNETKLASKKDPILKCIGRAWLEYTSAASTKKQSSWWPRRLVGAWSGNPEAKKRQNLRAAGSNSPFAHIELELWNATCCSNLNSPWTFGLACGVADTHICVSLCVSLNEFPLWILYLSSFCFDQMLSTNISWR